MPSISAENLIAALKGEPEAVAWMDKVFIPKIMGYIKSQYRELTLEDRKEIISDFLTRLAKEPPQLEGKGNHPTAALSCWITKTVNTCYLDWMRKISAKKRLRTKEISLEEAGTYDNQGNDKELFNIRIASLMVMNTLEETEKIIVEQYYIYGKTKTRIAYDSGYPQKYVKKVLDKYHDLVKQAYKYVQKYH